ncbi:hypothetical protein FANTH_12647 [Fusarium anthophilum]|uniref:Uncharacterized protein n=1 Tax=Fusarium anthophilum TaxID=48485 RepID=A0A8H4YS74_9HYPO|nr:hypothetical protein FANTH_12647 [Fusarium anthophilum]
MAPTRQEDKQHNRKGYAERVARKSESAQSGSGRGTIRPHKNRDSSRYAQTMAERHGITKAQNRHQTEEDDVRLVTVKVEEGRHDNGAEDLTDVSGQQQNNSMAYPQDGNNEALPTKFVKREYTTQVAQAAEALFGRPTPIPAYKPYDSDRMAIAEAKRLRYDLARSTSAVIPSTVTPLRPPRERITAPYEARNPCAQAENVNQAAQAVRTAQALFRTPTLTPAPMPRPKPRPRRQGTTQ